MKRSVTLLLVVATAVAVWTWLVLTATPFEHFTDFYFFPDGEPWWRGAVWGNVVAIWPSAPVIAVLGVSAYVLHRRAIAPLHATLDRIEVAHRDLAGLKDLADALDPGTESETILDTIADRVDDHTETGIGAILRRLPKEIPHADQD